MKCKKLFYKNILFHTTKNTYSRITFEQNKKKIHTRNQQKWKEEEMMYAKTMIFKKLHICFGI